MLSRYFTPGDEQANTYRLTSTKRKRRGGPIHAARSPVVQRAPSGIQKDHV